MPRTAFPFCCSWLPSSPLKEAVQGAVIIAGALEIRVPSRKSRLFGPSRGAFFVREHA